MKDCTLSKIQYAADGDDVAAEVTLTGPDKKKTFVAFSDCDDSPRFYRSDKSLFDKLLTDRGEPKREEELEKYRFLAGEDYIDIFNNVEPQWLPICRYLIFAATEDEESVQALAERTKGKKLSEIEAPVPGREPEDLYMVNYSDLSVVYRYRLMVETSIKNPSIYSDLEDTVRREKAILKKLKAACDSEKAYKVWKKDLIDAKMQDVIENEHIIVCEYMFIGIGHYQEIMPAEMIDAFKCWIDGNGSAFFLGSRDATEDEIRDFVSQHIADELLGMNLEQELSKDGVTLDEDEFDL